MKPLAQQNLYEILDVPFDASSAAIAEAVERAQALYAPGSLATYTLMDPEEEQLLLRLLEEARATLLDPAARARYDERITGPDSAPPQPAPATAPAIDPAIRAVWPELPVVGAAPPQSRAEEEHEDESWEDVPDDLPAPNAVPVAGRPPPPVIPAAQLPSPPVPQAAAAPPAALPAAAPPAGQRPPILLSREVAPPPPERAAATPAPVATPVPTTTPVPAAAVTVPPAEGTTWSGEVLRQIREARGISLQQISERTKVTRHHIENIEADRFELLPAAVYLRGILLSVARELRLDGQKVARSYLERVTAASSPTTPMPRPR